MLTSSSGTTVLVSSCSIVYADLRFERSPREYEQKELKTTSYSQSVTSNKPIFATPFKNMLTRLGNHTSLLRFILYRRCLLYVEKRIYLELPFILFHRRGSNVAILTTIKREIRIYIEIKPSSRWFLKQEKAKLFHTITKRA